MLTKVAAIFVYKSTKSDTHYILFVKEGFFAGCAGVCACPHSAALAATRTVVQWRAGDGRSCSCSRRPHSWLRGQLSLVCASLLEGRSSRPLTSVVIVELVV